VTDGSKSIPLWFRTDPFCSVFRHEIGQSISGEPSKVVHQNAGRASLNAWIFARITLSRPTASRFFWRILMPSTAQVGSILIEGWPMMTQLRDSGREPYSGNWNLLNELSVAFDRSVRAAGWNFFFMAAEVKVSFFGAPGARQIENAVKRILAKIKPQDFNGLEITGIVAKRFLGVPYATVSAHTRHLQASCYLDDVEQRRAMHRAAGE
jgi:hypothetical protein